MRLKKRVLSLLLIACLVVGILPATALAASTDGIQLGTSGISGGRASSVYYGTWNGSGIEWLVLDTKTNTGADGLFLLSKELLGDSSQDGGVYFNNSGSASNAWQGSDAQKWCTDFAGKTTGAYTYWTVPSAFTNQEQSQIIETTKTDGSYRSDEQSVPYAEAQNILSNESVFFLSAQEAETYFPKGAAGNPDRVASGAGDGLWWLRSPFEPYTLMAGVVNRYGIVGRSNVSDAWVARPAFNLKLNAVLFTSAAAGGKASGAEGAAALNSVTANSTTAWKLTLLDNAAGSGRENFAVSTTAVSTTTAGGNVDVAYSGARTGTKEYLSAMIVESSNAVLYYGRLNNLTSGEESGTQTIAIPALAAGSYTLKVFTEEYNGDQMTDYASAMKDVTLTVTPVAPTITTASLPDGTVGTAYSQTLAATGDAPIDWSVTSGSLPAGLSLDTATGVISGTPTAAGTTSFTVVATNSAGSDEKELSIPINAAAVQQYSINVSANDATYGTVSGGGSYNSGDSVTVTATANSGYKFVKWTEGGSEVSTSASYTFTAAADRTLVAVFEADDSSGGGDPDPHSHSGGTATCQSPATCSGCGQPYGGTDSSNHTGGTEVRDKVDATTTAEGYTGDTYCLGCNTKIATGTTIPKFPDTGDDSQMGLWIGLMMSALAGLAACAVTWRRKYTR